MLYGWWLNHRTWSWTVQCKHGLFRTRSHDFKLINKSRSKMSSTRDLSDCIPLSRSFVVWSDKWKPPGIQYFTSEPVYIHFFSRVAKCMFPSENPWGVNIHCNIEFVVTYTVHKKNISTECLVCLQLTPSTSSTQKQHCISDNLPPANTSSCASV